MRRVVLFASWVIIVLTVAAVLGYVTRTTPAPGAHGDPVPVQATAQP